MGNQSKLEIAISALNQATGDIDRLKTSLKEATNAQTEQNKAAQEGEKTTQNYKNTLGGTVEELTGFSLETLTVAASAAVLVEGLKKSVETTVQLGEATERLTNLTGATAEQASSMNTLFGTLGISTETLTRALEAAVRKGYQPSIEGLNQMRAEYNSIQDPIAQTKYLMDTFGRSGDQLAEYFKLSDDQLQHLNYTVQQSGLVMSKSGVEATLQYTRQLAQLDNQWKGVEVTIGNDVIPILTDALRSTNNQSEANKILQGTVLDTGERMRQTAIITQALTNAQKDDVQEVGFLKNATEDLRNTTDNTTQSNKDLAASTESAKQKAADLKNQTNELNQVMGSYTKTLEFQMASEGLSVQQKLELARVMGLVNVKSFEAQATTENLRKEFEAGQITTAQYYAAVASLASGIDSLHDKTITVTTNFVTNGSTSYDATSQQSTRSTNSSDRQMALKDKRDQQTVVTGKAIGGAVGAGDFLTGENGPEMVHLDPGSSGHVVNNYDMTTNYNLTAHYPTYQDPNAARNDLAMLTMMKNPGAAKWAVK